MSNPNQLIDAVKTAKSIHDGDYSFLRDKSFVIRGNMKNNKGQGRHVKKSKGRLTLVDLSKKIDNLGKDLRNEMNARFDTLTSDVNSLKRDVKSINARLDYIVEANNLKDNK